MDCGPGTAGQIALHIPPDRLTGAAISHFHPDHYFDLVALYYLLKFGPRRRARLPVWLPTDGAEFLDRFGQVVSEKPRLLEDVLDLREYPSFEPVRIGKLQFEFHPVQHYIPAYAMRVTGAEGKVLVFSGDVAPCREITV